MDSMAPCGALSPQYAAPVPKLGKARAKTGSFISLTCNRPTNHTGTHRHYRANDFALLGEWNRSWVKPPEGVKP